MKQKALENPFKNPLLNKLMNNSGSKKEEEAKDNPR